MKLRKNKKQKGQNLPINLKLDSGYRTSDHIHTFKDAKIITSGEINLGGGYIGGYQHGGWIGQNGLKPYTQPNTEQMQAVRIAQLEKELAEANRKIEELEKEVEEKVIVI